MILDWVHWFKSSPGPTITVITGFGMRRDWLSGDLSLICDPLSLQHKLRHVVTKEAERPLSVVPKPHICLPALAQVNAYSF